MYTSIGDIVVQGLAQKFDMQHKHPDEMSASTYIGQVTAHFYELHFAVLHVRNQSIT
jgi:hypothetical protein